MFTFHDGLKHNVEQVSVHALRAQQWLHLAALQLLHSDDEVGYALHGQWMMGNLQVQALGQLGAPCLAHVECLLGCHLFLSEESSTGRQETINTMLIFFFLIYQKLSRQTLLSSATTTSYHLLSLPKPHLNVEEQQLYFEPLSDVWAQTPRGEISFRPLVSCGQWPQLMTTGEGWIELHPPLLYPPLLYKEQNNSIDYLNCIHICYN